jgi:hypothetical protein
MTAETGTLEEMLFLTIGVLCPDLLAVYTLHGETLGAPRGFVCQYRGRRVVG